MRPTDGTRQQLRWTTVEEEQTLPGLSPAGRVTYPEFRDIEFLHVAAKSLINHVPSASGMPFEWTINVYRGCTHACSYCLAGDTRILLPNGSTKPLSALRVGDAIVGTIQAGRYRRYVTTRVLDHWRTTKPAYRVTLDDGTELVASGDHRFLTPGGWAHVAPDVTAALPRPHLTVGDELVGPSGSDVISKDRVGHRELTTVGATPVMRAQRAPRGPLTSQRRRVTGIEPHSPRFELYDITTGTGDFVANGVVSHNCFARPTHEYLDLDAGRDFERVIVVKVNAVERLRAELARPSWGGHHIAMGTNTDPYQRCEGRYRLTRGVVETLTEAANPFSVLTKGTLALRDLDLFEVAAERCGTSVSYSIGTLDEHVWRSSEPGTPHPRKRMEAVAALNEAGVPSGVMLAPILPGLSDDPGMIEQVVKAAVEAGATHLTAIPLHLRPGVRPIYLDWLRREHPELVPHYRRTFRSSYQSKEDRNALSALVRTLVQRHAPPSHPLRRRDSRPRPGARTPAASTSGSSTEPEQLGLGL